MLSRFTGAPFHKSDMYLHNFSDASFMDWASFLCHGLWIMPMQIIIGVGLLIGNLGYSALVGVAVSNLSNPFLPAP